MLGENWHRHLMQAALHDRLHQKQGRSIARWTVAEQGRELTVFVKRHYRHARWLGWLARLLPGKPWSDARCEWHHLRRAESLGLRVPRALAVAEWVGPGGRLQSALIVEELAGMLALHEAIPRAARLLPANQFRTWKRGLTAELVRLVRLLHDHGYFHRDLYLCHFFVATDDLKQPPESWQGRLAVIDFHRLTRSRWLSFRSRVKDLAQLLYSARVEGITTGDIAHFWRLYRGSCWLRWAVKLKARVYRRRNRAG
jgi:heptose I phosphotransferase